MILPWGYPGPNGIVAPCYELLADVGKIHKGK